MALQFLHISKRRRVSWPTRPFSRKISHIVESSEPASSSEIASSEIASFGIASYGIASSGMLFYRMVSLFPWENFFHGRPSSPPSETF